MTPTEAAEVIGVTSYQIRTLIRNGRLKARKIKTGVYPFYRYSLTRRECERYRDEPQARGWPRGRSRSKKTKGAKR